jgi:hypothetical protein
MDLKILIFCRLVPWVLSWIWQIGLVPAHHVAYALAEYLMNLYRVLCFGVFSRTAVVVAVFALIDRAESPLDLF